MEPTTTPNLAMTEPTTRRKRIENGAHRSWEIRARYGTAESDRWTLVGNPVPAQNNPAADYEDGQFATLEEAREAQQAAEAADDGTHLEG